MTQQGESTGLNNTGELVFSNPQDEIAHLKQKLLAAQQEFLEFQESSRDLEVEYETQIKQLDKNNVQTSIRLERLEDENEQLKARYSTYASETQYKLNEYQNQVSDFTLVNGRLTAYIRELEQSNDDLERARRALTASLEDFEGQLNQQIERNVLLENEVSEKEELECLVQRLKEEARDLRSELTIKNNKPEVSKRESAEPQLETTSMRDPAYLFPQHKDNTTITSNGTSSTPRELGSSVKSDLHISGFFDERLSIIDSTTKLTAQDSTESSGANLSLATTKSIVSQSQQTSTPSSPTREPAIGMSPATRISALKIVSDLLRKVGAMESKIASAKKMTSNQE